MDRMRVIAAVAAITSILSLILAIAFFAGTNSDSVASGDTASSSGAADELPTSTPTPFVAPTATTVPTAEPTSTPEPESVAVIELPTAQPLEPEPTAVPSVGQWCVGERAIDVRLAPADASEVIGSIEASVCDLEQLADVQQGWMAVRSGTGLGLIEGWVWAVELTAVE